MAHRWIADFAGGIQSHVTHHASRITRPTRHHCADPGCLNGCPVLAYDKDPVTGIVRHLDDQCMDCSYCVMKCPYEVPKYSSRLGIVRKCDMCHQRLAVGEAPACVQACPDEAIRISILRSDKVRGKYRGLPVQQEAAGSEKRRPEKGKLIPGLIPALASVNPSLADTPNPAITLPSTRYLTSHLRPDLVAADHDALRLDQAHWPLVIMLVLTQAAAGMFVAAAVAQLVGIALVKPLAVVGFAVLVAGLTASILHLGQPRKAWRAFLGWRKSWLSREIFALNTLAGVAALAILALVTQPTANAASGW